MNLANTPDSGDEVDVTPKSERTVIYQRLQSTTPMVLGTTDQPLSQSYSTHKLTDTGVSHEGSIGQDAQGAPVYETTPRVSMTPRNRDVILTNTRDSGDKVEGQTDATDLGLKQGNDRSATDSARNDETEPRDPATSTSRVRARTTHGRGDPVENHPKSLHTGVSNEGTVRPVIRFAPTTTHVPVIRHEVYDTQASHGANAPGSPNSKEGAAHKDGNGRQVLPPDDRSSPHIVPHNPDRTLGVMHGRPVRVHVDPRSEGSGSQDEGGESHFPRGGPGGGERGRMPVERRGRVDSETGCKLTFSTTAWIA